MGTNLTPEEYQKYAQPRAWNQNIPWEMYKSQIQLESGWRQYASDGSVLSSPTGSKGLGQLNSRYYPQDIWENWNTNLDMSMRVMSGYRSYGSWRKALAAYNWGSGNVGGYTDLEGNSHPVWDGTREWVCPVGLPACQTAQRNRYLDTILGPGWPEPTESGGTMPDSPDAPAPVSAWG